jgi:prevent-host-death family protein
MNNTQTITISDLRQNATAAINAVAATQNSTIILQRSHPKAVLVDVAYFQSLEDAVLDLTDTQEANHAKKEPRVSLDSYIKKRWGKVAL